MLFEQVNNSTGATLFLHHDQQGSTGILTEASGLVGARYAYDGYGNLFGISGAASTPMRYDGQYTSLDSGLIYLRARTYDSSTAQFVSVDPIAMVTRAPYVYSNSDPLNRDDLTGAVSIGDVVEGVLTTGGCALGASGCALVNLGIVDAKVLWNDAHAIFEPCRATELREKSLRDLEQGVVSTAVGSALPTAESTIPEAARQSLGQSVPGRVALAQLGGLNGFSAWFAGLQAGGGGVSNACGCG